jgi:hypothetical protein
MMVRVAQIVIIFWNSFSFIYQCNSIKTPSPPKTPSYGKQKEAIAGGN